MSRTPSDLFGKVLAQGEGITLTAPKLLTVFERTAMLLSSNTSQVLVDDWIDLAEFGVYVHSNTVHMNVIVEREVNGAWRDIGSQYDGIHIPGIDTTPPEEGYVSEVGFFLGDFQTPAASIDPSNFLNVSVSAPGRDSWWPTPGGPRDAEGDRHSTRVRVVVRCNCSSGLHDAKRHRIRVNIRVPDYTVWKLDVPILSTDGIVLRDEPVLDLSPYGYSSDASQLLVTYMVKRNGRLIRAARDPDPFGREGDVVGDPLDPPTFPVRVFANPLHETESPWYAKQNGEFGTPGPMAAGFYRAGTLGNCTAAINQFIKFYVVREGPLAATYLPTVGGAPAPVPANSGDNTTLTIRLLRAQGGGLNLVPPFISDDLAVHFQGDQAQYDVFERDVEAGVPQVVDLRRVPGTFSTNLTAVVPTSGPGLRQVTLTPTGYTGRVLLYVSWAPFPVFGAS